jgi:hypothetical protein
MVRTLQFDRATMVLYSCHADISPSVFNPFDCISAFPTVGDGVMPVWAFRGHTRPKLRRHSML